jgi:hypothetical protein
MLYAHVNAALARLSFDNLVWVIAGEMSRRNGHNYLTVFADLMTQRVLGAAPGKHFSVWAAFVEELLRHNGHLSAIQHLAIDISTILSTIYSKLGSDNLGNARVV